VVHKWDLTKDSGGCQVGVRTDSKAYLWKPGSPTARATVGLTSASSKAVPKTIKSKYRRATAAEARAIFTSANRLGASAVKKACKL
jgi:hypothetical protein